MDDLVGLLLSAPCRQTICRSAATNLKFCALSRRVVCRNAAIWPLWQAKRTRHRWLHAVASDRLRHRHRSIATYSCPIKSSVEPIGCRSLGSGADMRRRDFIALVGGVVISSPASAQQTAKQGFDPWLLGGQRDGSHVSRHLSEYTPSLVLDGAPCKCPRWVLPPPPDNLD
jgi:hypothetical protein